MKDLFGQFESLGANCEFGFVLRRAGLEAQSLLRWAMVPTPQALIAAISAGFAGLYDFENLVPFNEGMVLDRPNGIAWHSALRSVREDGGLRFVDTEADRRDIHRFEAARIADLAAKARQALAAGERIFVYHKFHGELVPPEIAHLFATLRRHGPVRLLVVSPATREQPPGSVKEHVPGLLHGYIDRFAPGDHADDVSQDVWENICRNAIAMAPRVTA